MSFSICRGGTGSLSDAVAAAKPRTTPVRGFGVNEIEAAAVCQSCIEIDKQIERQRQLLHSTTDPSEVERVYRLIAQLYGDKVRLHQNPPS